MTDLTRPVPTRPSRLRAAPRLLAAAGLVCVAWPAGCAKNAPPEAQAPPVVSQALRVDPPQTADPDVAELAERIRSFADGFNPSLAEVPAGPDEPYLAPGVEPYLPDAADPGPAAAVRVTRDDGTHVTAGPLADPLADASDGPPVLIVPAETPVPDETVPPTSARTDVRDDVRHTRDVEEDLLARHRSNPAAPGAVLDLVLLDQLLADGPASADARTASLADEPSAAAPAPYARHAREALGALSPDEARILAVFDEGLRRFRTNLGGDTRRMTPADKVAPLLEMNRVLRREVGLTLPTVALCSEVRMFGVYEPVPASFPLGQAQPVVLYAEVDNFASEPQPDGRWRTSLTVSATLYDEEGRPVADYPARRALDTSRQRRRDYFFATVVTLPAVNAAGDHVLKVTVEDELAGRITEEVVRVRFGS